MINPSQSHTLAGRLKQPANPSLPKSVPAQARKEKCEAFTNTIENKRDVSKF
jgi:hypothetical protein